jgi:TIR domain
VYLLIFFSEVSAAIEGAEITLICMSSKYAISDNCILEGEYVLQQKKKYIPLLMEKGFKPTGWY